MKRLSYNKLNIAIVGLAVGIIAITAVAEISHFDNVEEYSIAVGNEQLHFIAQPQMGYVLRTQYEAMDTISSFLMNTKDVEISTIGGRKGTYVIYNENSAEENDRTMKAFGISNEVHYAAPLFLSNGETVVVIPEIVVRVKPGIEVEQVQMLCESAGCAIIKRMEFTEQEYLIEALGPDANAVFLAVEKLSQAPEVEWACPNTASQSKLYGDNILDGFAPGERLQINYVEQDANSFDIFPNDEYFPMQWHLHNTGQSGGTPGADINAPEAWEITTGDPKIIIAVIDCGVDSQHPDLAKNLIAGYDFYENDDVTDPVKQVRLDAHGTCCAGVIAAEGNNGIGVVGVAPNCKIMPIRHGSASSWITTDQHATAFRWAAAHGANIISCSWGRSNAPNIHSAIQDVTKIGGIGREGKGCLVFVAVGISGNRIVSGWTEAYPEVIAVGATDHNDMRWNYSDYGSELKLTAPSGCDGGWCGSFSTLWTTDLTGSQGNSIFNDDPNLLDYAQYWGGTSASSPITAGVAALILSVEPNLTNDEVRHFLTRSAKDLGDPGWDEYYGWGRVDAKAALDMVLAKRCDLNNDWKVDEEDLAIFNDFLGTNDSLGDIAPPGKRDGVVDEQDLEFLMQFLHTEIPELNLIAHWKLDEKEGDIAYEIIQGKDGTLHGELLWQPDGGMVDGALKLDGVDDYVAIPFVLDPADGEFSIFVWVKEGASGQTIISQTDGMDWLSADTSEGNLMTELKGTGRGSSALLSQTNITDGNWHRIGLVWDGSQRTLYVDDIVAAEDSQNGLDSSDSGLYIGTSKAMEAGTYWSGLIDDVRIYNRAVSP
jgi:subtilisin family serine protease